MFHWNAIFYNVIISLACAYKLAFVVTCVVMTDEEIKGNQKWNKAWVGAWNSVVQMGT